MQIVQQLNEYMQEGDALLKQEQDSGSWEAEVKAYIERTLGAFEALEWSKP